MTDQQQLQALHHDMQVLAAENQQLKDKMAAIELTLGHGGDHNQRDRKSNSIPLPTFTYESASSRAFREWQFGCRMRLKAQDIVAPQSIYLLLGALHGRAFDIAHDLQDRIANYPTTDLFLQELELRFSSKDNATRSAFAYNSRVQLPNEEIKVYAGLLADAYRDAFGPNIDQGSIIKKFITGLRIPGVKTAMLQLQVYNAYPKTLEEAVDKAVSLESAGVISQLHDSYNKLLTSSKWNTTMKTNEPMEIGACSLHPNAQHDDKNCKTQRWTRDATKTKEKTMICYRCQRTGHMKKDCRVKLPTNTNVPTPKPKSGN